MVTDLALDTRTWQDYWDGWEITNSGLSKEDVHAFKNAKRAYMSAHGGSHSIRITMDLGKVTRGKIEGEHEHTVYVAGVFRKDWKNTETPNWASAPSHSVYYGPLETIFQTLREGDLLKLVWDQGSHSTQALQAQGFEGDSLHLHVERPQRTADGIIRHAPMKHFDFLIDVMVVNADSTARMIRVT